jgi:hypothetical protein
MKRIFTLFGLLLAIQTNAKEAPKYPVSDIPEELKANANVVVREDQIKFKILEQSRASYYVHLVVTILNEKGNHYASEDIQYDRLTKILDLNAIVYNAQGTVIKKLKNKEIYDHSSFDGFTLFSDDRIKSIDLSQSTYPYTVEFEYEMEYKFLYYIPGSWWGGENVSYQHSSYELTYPTALKPRYKLYNIDVAPQKSSASEFETLTWTFENIKPMKFESLGPSRAELIPHIEAAPSDFEFEGYAGNMNSWLEYGRWQQSLNKDRNALPEKVKQNIREITKNLSTTEEKAKAVYEYMQSKTRYVGIQLGIGGWQPFPAAVVDQNGYGDCKALSNYTVALLNEAGVKGYYTKIFAGKTEKNLNTTFPSNQFNHIVVSVPNGKDTLWLECTDQTNPFGYQGTFTEDRWALMVTEDGGKLVRTINYKPEQNLQSRTAQVSIDDSGNGKANIKSTQKGIQYENGGLNETFSSADKQKRWIENNTDIPNFNINTFSISEKKEKIPSATVTLDLTLNKYASVSGKRIFIRPNLMNRITYVPEKIADRKTEVVRRSNYIDLDTISFSLPENLYPEFLPEPVKINSRFGEYEANFKFESGKVTYTRRMKVWKGRFPKETYNELVDFYKNVSKADNIKLVFLNKT